MRKVLWSLSFLWIVMAGCSGTSGFLEGGTEAGNPQESRFIQGQVPEWVDQGCAADEVILTNTQNKQWSVAVDEDCRFEQQAEVGKIYRLDLFFEGQWVAPLMYEVDGGLSPYFEVGPGEGPVNLGLIKIVGGPGMDTIALPENTEGVEGTEL